jgi:outer membrane protein
MKHIFRFLLIALFCVTVPSVGSAQKIGHINRDSVIRIMPEYKKMIDSLTNMRIEMENTALGMLMEYQRKKRERDSLDGKRSPLILAVMDNDLAALEQRYMDFSQLADENLQATQIALITPLFKKVDDAIAVVAKANGYSYILDSSEGGMVLFSLPGNDVFSLVCKQLNITPPPKSPPAGGGTPAPGGQPK